MEQLIVCNKVFKQILCNKIHAVRTQHIISEIPSLEEGPEDSKAMDVTNSQVCNLVVHFLV